MPMTLTVGSHDKPGLQMPYRPCGKHSLSLSALGVGCWAFEGGQYWGHQDQKDNDGHGISITVPANSAGMARKAPTW